MRLKSRTSAEADIGKNRGLIKTNIGVANRTHLSFITKLFSSTDRAIWPKSFSMFPNSEVPRVERKSIRYKRNLLDHSLGQLGIFSEDSAGFLRFCVHELLGLIERGNPGFDYRMLACRPFSFRYPERVEDLIAHEKQRVAKRPVAGRKQLSSERLQRLDGIDVSGPELIGHVGKRHFDSADGIRIDAVFPEAMKY